MAEAADKGDMGQTAELPSMTVDRMVRLFAGVMILVSVVLTHLLHPYRVLLTLFTGFNLAQSGLTNLCPFHSGHTPVCGSRVRCKEPRTAWRWQALQLARPFTAGLWPG